MNTGAISSKLATVGGPKVQIALAKVVKNSPQILTIVGLLGGIGSTILIAKATLRLEAILDRFEGYKATAHLHKEMYSEKEFQREIAKVYGRFVLDLVKLYGPGVSLGIASMISIAAAQGISQRRQVALVAAVKSAESALQAYRARVTEAIGADKEADIWYGVTTETIEDENGKKVKVRKFDPTGLPSTVRYFDETNRNWQRGARELNLLFLKNHQTWANQRLHARGFVYLNEVLSWLGMTEIPEGQVTGWVVESLGGQGYIDFGVDNIINKQANKQYDDGSTEGIMLDFNIDGEILSRLA